MWLMNISKEYNYIVFLTHYQILSLTEGLRFYYTGKRGGVGGCMVHSHSAILRMHMYRYYRSFQDGMAAE